MVTMVLCDDFCLSLRQPKGKDGLNLTGDEATPENDVRSQGELVSTPLSADKPGL